MRIFSGLIFFPLIHLLYHLNLTEIFLNVHKIKTMLIMLKKRYNYYFNRLKTKKGKSVAYHEQKVSEVRLFSII
jgi:hypothetical protein